MPNSTRLLTTLALFVAALFLSPVAPAAAKKPNALNPDLTKGEPIPKGYEHDWNLGATGARGWMYSERLTTITARQIAITKIHPGSPADGVLQVGDVILGVGGKPFAYDPRTEFGKALTQAEAEMGQLVLRVWRDGKTGSMRLKLPVLGTYSETAPYNCEKSKRIFEQGCEALAQKMADPKYRGNAITRPLNALALLASGEEKYLPLIKREAQWAADFKTNSFPSWWYGYTMMLLSEYILETGDQSVMSGLQRLAKETAAGQSIVGSWGHGFAEPTGRANGYGMMQAPSLTLATGLILAREAGVNDPSVNEAIEKSVRLFRFYVNKGCLPYGDHDPWTQTHDSNGKNGVAAILFNLLGDKQAAEYFSRMSVAAHNGDRDTGHTGNFLNITWSMPGVNLSGPNATGAWMNAFGGWYYDLARQWDGTFRHQGPPEPKYDRYKNWDTTGATLLAYAMPLKKLRITGKGKNVVPQVTAKQAQGLIEDGRGWNNLDRNSYYDAMSTEQLLGRLSSWSPIVRERTGMALKRRKAKVLPELIEMLKSDDLYTQYGACKAFKHVDGDHAAAVPVLIETFESEDTWLRILAAQALAGIGKQAKPAVPAMLKRLAHTQADDDPRRMEQRFLSFALFDRKGGLIGRSLDGVDRDLLADAVRAGLTNDDGRARSAVSSVYNQLTLEEIRPLLPAILQAVVEPAPSGVMFASGIRTEGVRILAKHHVEEGIQIGAAYLAETWNQWGAKNRTPALVKHITAYEANAQRIIPILEQVAGEMTGKDFRAREARQRGHDKLILDAIEKIKASQDNPEMIKIGLPRVGQIR